MVFSCACIQSSTSLVTTALPCSPLTDKRIDFYGLVVHILSAADTALGARWTCALGVF